MNYLLLLFIKTKTEFVIFINHLIEALLSIVSKGYEKAKGSLDISGHKAPSDMTKPILHVVKGKYFRNTSVSSDIETDGPSFTCAIGQWFWKDDTGKWNPYCTEMNAKINKCYKRDPKSTVVVNVENQT